MLTVLLSVLLRSLLVKQNTNNLFWRKGPIDGHFAKSPVFQSALKSNFATKPAVVNLKGLGGSEELPRRAAVVAGGLWILRGPFQQNRIVRVARAVGQEVGLGGDVRCIGVGVELAIAARAPLRELWMEGKTLKPA